MPSFVRGAMLAVGLVGFAALSWPCRAEEDKYTLEQLDRAHDIITGMHPDQRGALYRRAADVELTAEELFLDEERSSAAIAGSRSTFGGISAMPNVPEDPPPAARGKGRSRR